MNALPLLQIAGYSIPQVAILIIVAMGVVGIVLALAQKFGVPVDPVVIRIGWIVLLVVLGIVAVKFIASMM